jgi:hypothetical protein
VIERLWKFCKKTVLRHFYRRFSEFTGAIDAFFDNLSEHRDALATLMTENFEVVKCR